MSKNLLIITAQVFENYNHADASNGPNWKPKMGQIFTLNVEADYFMYAEKEAVEAIKKLLQAKSNSYCKYEYREHEIIFGGFEELNDEAFEEEIHKELQKGEK